MTAPSEPDARDAADNTATDATPLAYRVVRGGLWVLASSYWSIGFGFVINIVLTRLLAPEDYGVFALAGFYAQLFLLQPKLALSYGFVQSQDTSDRALGTYLGMELLTAAASLLITGVGAWFLPRETAWVVLLLVGVAVTQSITGIGSVLLDKELRFDVTSRITVIAFTISYIPAVLMARSGYGVWSLVAQIVTNGLLVSLAYLWLYRRLWRDLGRYLRQWHTPTARHFVRFGLTVGLTFFAGGLTTTLDNYFIGTFVGATALGFYDRAYRMAQWPGLLFNSILSRTAYYTYARLQDDSERLAKSASMIFWMISMLGVPLALAIFVSAPDLILLLYGERWLPGAPLLRILALVFLARPLWDNANTIATAVGKPQLATKVSIIWLVVFAGLGLPMALLGGALGVSITVGLASIIGVTLMLRVLSQSINIHTGVIVWNITILTITTLVVYYAIVMYIDLPSSPSLLVSVVTQMVGVSSLYSILMLLFEPHETIHRLHYMLRLIRPRT